LVTACFKKDIRNPFWGSAFFLKQRVQTLL
jgi:hypothetical protein